MSTSNITTTSIDLSWSGNGNTSTTTYEVNFATNAAFVSTSTFYAVTVSSTFANLSSNTTYYFRVRTVNGDGIFTGFANTIYARTLPTPVLDQGRDGRRAWAEQLGRPACLRTGTSSSLIVRPTNCRTSPLAGKVFNNQVQQHHPLGNALTVGETDRGNQSERK